MNDFQNVSSNSDHLDYDVFEEVPGGGTIWRECVPGLENVERKLRELSTQTENTFFALNLMDRTQPTIRCAKSAAEELDYELFEEFSDGTAVWRDCARGMDQVEIRLRELTKKSGHKFFVLHLDEPTRGLVREIASGH